MPICHGTGRSRDAGAVTAHRINFQGPPALAMRAATLLADAEGVELLSSLPPERGADPDVVLLGMTIDGTTDDVLDAVALVRTELPEGKIEIVGHS